MYVFADKYKITRFATIVCILMVLVACSSFKVKDETQPQAISSDMGEPLLTTEEGSALMSEAGMINIQRHTKEYTISMILDATDDNVYFVMDLPQDESEALTDESELNPEDEVQDTLPDQKSAKTPVEAPAEASKYVLYAQTYFFERKYDRAIAEVDRAIEIEPDSAVAHSLKGSIHFKRGETDKAKKSWQRSLELDPNQEDVKKALGAMK